MGGPLHRLHQSTARHRRLHNPLSTSWREVACEKSH
jgi:hypothetical protein